MSTTIVPVTVHPLGTRRPQTSGVSRIVTILPIGLGSLLLFIGIILAIVGTNVSYHHYGYHYYETSPTRKVGIANIVIGGVTFLVGVVLAVKASRESKTIQGRVLSPVQGQNPNTAHAFQARFQNPVTHQQTGYCSHGYNHNMVPEPPIQGYTGLQTGPVHYGQNPQSFWATSSNSEIPHNPASGVAIPPPYEYEKTKSTEEN